MKIRRTVGTIWLFVFFLFLLAVPGGTQELAPTPSPETTRSEPESPKPKTVGEALWGEKEAASPEAETSESPQQAESTEPGTQKIDLPDREEPSEDWATEGEVGESTFVDKLIQVSWSLAIISFLIWVSAKIAGRAGLKELGVGGAPKSMIEVLERKRLSPGRSILLMKVGPKVLAVAATEKGYETLTEFEGEEFKQYQDALPESQKPDPEEPPPPEGVTTPSDILRHYLSIIPGTGAKK